MALVINRSYYLKINNVPLACPAWQVMDLSPLFESATLRGADRVLPRATGRRGLPRVVDATVYTFPFEVVGMSDSDGSTLTDSAAGVTKHFDYLQSNLGLASTSGDGTVSIVFVRGSTAQATTGHFLGFKGSRLLPPAVVRTTFDISVPSGAWTSTTP